jgi:signal transduction histidine kinase
MGPDKDNISHRAEHKEQKSFDVPFFAGDKKTDTDKSLDNLKSENKLLRKKVEELQEADRLKTAFLNNIAQEIRTPLNAITGFCAFLTDPALTHEKRVAFTKIILDSSDNLLFIITDIANIAAIETGKEDVQYNEFNLNVVFQVLYEQYEQRAREQGNLFKYKSPFPDSDAKIITDKTKITRILSNLINNAMKFTGRGKVIYGCRQKNDFLEFYVKDTGIGIPPELQKDVFQRFRQVDNSDNRYYGGSGLGLSISKAYIEMLGGKIWVESEPGRGSTFRFTIPFKRSLT